MKNTSVVIGVPTLNGTERLQRCLHSIATCTNLGEFKNVKLLICDDGSEPDVLDANKTVVHAMSGCAGVEMIMNHARLGIAKSWNRLVRHQQADVCVLINDDIEVVDHWLSVLVYSLLKNERLGMLGLNAYVGLTKEQARQSAPWLAPSNHFVDYREATLMTAGGTLLSSHGPIFGFRRKAYDEAEGFDERYFCFYEELDFGVTLRRMRLPETGDARYFHAMASYPIVYHMGGATTSEPKNMDAAKEMEKSRRLFIEKWVRTPSELRADLPSIGPDNHREWNSQAMNWT